MPEILKDLQADYEKKSLVSFSDAAEMFKFAKNHVASRRKSELSFYWDKAAASPITPHQFLREFLWCVYVSGFSAKTISKKYDALLQAHWIEDADGQFIPPTSDVLSKDAWDRLLDIFANQRKAEYVQLVRKKMADRGWYIFHTQYVSYRDPQKFRLLKGIGPALSCHLARNLGNVNVCKPDVHLVRVAKKYGLPSVHALCESVSSEPVGKTDLILWLASVDNGTT